MNIIDTIQDQIAKAKDGCNLGVVSHMSGGMAMRVAAELDLVSEDACKKAIRLLGHSCIIHEDDESEWCVTFRR